MSTTQPTVRFEFGPAQLTGAVVDVERQGRFNRPNEALLTIETESGRYRVHESAVDLLDSR